MFVTLPILSENVNAYSSNRTYIKTLQIQDEIISLHIRLTYTRDPPVNRILLHTRFSLKHYSPMNRILLHTGLSCTCYPLAHRVCMHSGSSCTQVDSARRQMAQKKHTNLQDHGLRIAVKNHKFLTTFNQKRLASYHKSLSDFSF